MGIGRQVKRYSSYYPGWCVAFGDHEVDYAEEENINWIFGDKQIGLILSDRLKRQLFREMLGRQKEHPRIWLTEDRVQINQVDYPFSEKEKEGALRFREFVLEQPTLYLYLTSHFCYPSGTRIVTFSPRRPAIILYKEITPLSLEMP